MSRLELQHYIIDLIIFKSVTQVFSISQILSISQVLVQYYQMDESYTTADHVIFSFSQALLLIPTTRFPTVIGETIIVQQ